MKTIQVKVRTIDEAAFAKKPVSEVPAGFQIISEPCKVVDEKGRTLIVLAKLPDENALNNLRKRLRNFKGFNKSQRGSGLVNTSKVFGYQPHAAVRMRPYCGSASVNAEDPMLSSMLQGWARELEAILGENAPTEFQHMEKTVSARVKPDWRIQGTVFTSGIVNKSNALAYHLDRGNFPGCWSAMVVLRKGITGGLLVVPEVGLAFDLPDCTALFFDGQGLWHGVTPIVKSDPLAERFTVVYYALSEMWKCLTLREEINEARRSRTETEVKRAKQC
jgi:hypothetical protein